MKQSEIETIIYQNTSVDHYRGSVRGISETAEILHKKTNLDEDEIYTILNHELDGDRYSGNVRGIDDAAKKIIKLIEKK